MTNGECMVRTIACSARDEIPDESDTLSLVVRDVTIVFPCRVDEFDDCDASIDSNKLFFR